MLPFREKIIVYCENNLEHKNTFCGSKAQSSFNVTADSNHCDLNGWVAGELNHNSKKLIMDWLRKEHMELKFCTLLSINSTEVHMTVTRK